MNVLSVLYPKTSNSLKVIAAVCILRKIVSVLVSIYKTCLRPRRNFQKRYGTGSWALVTGSSDGIGKAIAFEFARAGFNIVLSARTQSKLEGVKLELEDKFPNVEVRLLAVDYS